MSTFDQAKRINELETELAAWKTYAEQLAGAKRREDTRTLPVLWRLTPGETRLVLKVFDAKDTPIHGTRLYAACYGPRDGLMAEDYKVITVLISKARKKLAEQGVKILTVGHYGYLIEADSREIIAAAIHQRVGP